MSTRESKAALDARKRLIKAGWKEMPHEDTRHELLPCWEHPEYGEYYTRGEALLIQCRIDQENERLDPVKEKKI